MVDAKEGFFQLQARTKSAQGNSTQATIFSAGAAQEENTSIVEVRVKQGGKCESFHFNPLISNIKLPILLSCWHTLVTAETGRIS